MSGSSPLKRSSGWFATSPMLGIWSLIRAAAGSPRPWPAAILVGAASSCDVDLKAVLDGQERLK